MGKRPETPRALPCPLRRIAPQRRMIGITVRFDRIDNARMITIALSTLTTTRSLTIRPVARLLRLATAAKQSQGKLHRL